jgi:hypothetical protein
VRRRPGTAGSRQQRRLQAAAAAAAGQVPPTACTERLHSSPLEPVRDKKDKLHGEWLPARSPFDLHAELDRATVGRNVEPWQPQCFAMLRACELRAVECPKRGRNPLGRLSGPMLRAFGHESEAACSSAMSTRFDVVEDRLQRCGGAGTRNFV